MNTAPPSRPPQVGDGRSARRWIRWTSLGLLAVGLTAPRARAATLVEDFSTDPAARGWQVHGDASLFSWDSVQGRLRVTWDSARTNSYFHRPLNTVLGRTDHFVAAFDLHLEDVAAGTTPGKPQEFPLAVSLFNLADAQRTNLFIGQGVSGSGSGLRNAVEFNYFPDAGFGETFAVIAASGTPTNWSQFLYHHDYPTPLNTGVWHRVILTGDGGAQQITLTKTRAGLPYASPQTLSMNAAFGDFRLDTFAVSSYSDRVGLGSIRAHGWIDNIVLTLPDPPISNLRLTLTNGVRIHFESRAGWNYTLERGPSLDGWEAASGTTPGTGGSISLTDTQAVESRAFYRIRADRP